MRHSLILLAFVLMSLMSQARAANDLTIGTGFESRLGRDVNPDYTSTTGFGELYASLAMHPWTALLEIEMAQQSSNLGNYSVANTYYTTMAWGRYEPWSGLTVSPYVGLGLGWQFNDTVSQFGTARDEGWNDGGGIAGLAIGVMTTLYQHWNIEAEMRVAKFEFVSEPTWSFLVRTGYTF
jgi:hypothetical protein